MQHLFFIAERELLERFANILCAAAQAACKPVVKRRFNVLLIRVGGIVENIAAFLAEQQFQRNQAIEVIAH